MHLATDDATTEASPSNWEEANNAFLQHALAWLRFRLQQLAETRIPTSESNESFQSLCQQQINNAWQAMIELQQSDFPPALSILANRLGLSEFERHVLLLCGAMEFDPLLGELIAETSAGASRPYPTFSLCFQLFDDGSWDVVSSERPLRKLRLIELHQPGMTPLTSAALRADERITNFLKGLNQLDDRITPLLMPFEGEFVTNLPPSHRAIAEQVATDLDSVRTGPLSSGHIPLPLVHLIGSDAVSKQLVVREIAAKFGLELKRICAELIPTDFQEAEQLLRLWQREHCLLPLALYVDANETDAMALDRPSSPLVRFLARASGLLFLDTPTAKGSFCCSTLQAEVHKPTAEEQRSEWNSLISNEPLAEELAGQFNLNFATVQQIAAHVDSAESTDSVRSKVWNACRRASRPLLEQLAQRIEPKASWDDLVLPADELSQLHEIAGQIRHRTHVYDKLGFRARNNRGLGLSVLFAGDSGTGKTMAAEVIANELQLDLYRIDLSAVVNKYIGETEKNLRKLFDAADDCGAILFFDEADSLFGKRTEVKDSHDRYANLEVNYLLQRMEAYRGLAILATNLRSSLDAAFLRRLRFIVNFPVPDLAQRREMWRKAFPAQTPLAPLDLDRLARLGVTGGNIHTIALNAAFASVADTNHTHSPNSSSPTAPHAALAMSHILNAARTEFRKLQKPINAADFRTPDLEGTRR